MRLLHCYAAVFGWRVRGGPFRGLRYVRESVCSTLAPKLLGTYERELNGWVERIIQRNYATVINVGAAEGYYAVGLAYRSPQLCVCAFEGEEQGRTLIAELAALNHVSNRVTIAGLCTFSELAPHLAAPTAPLLLIDIEGDEVDLLDLERLPSLARCPMLIELHSHKQPAAEILRRRLAATHMIEEKWSEERTIDELPLLLRLVALFLGRDRILKLISENRPGAMCWFWCEPREATT